LQQRERESERELEMESECERGATKGICERVKGGLRVCNRERERERERDVLFFY